MEEAGARKGEGGKGGACSEGLGKYGVLSGYGALSSPFRNGHFHFQF